MQGRKLNVGEIVADKYMIEGVVAQGDCRIVYHAVQLGIDLPAVVMTPVPSVSPDDKSNHHRFEREVLDAARLRHPHAISILDAGHTKEGLPYVVTERLEGQTLAELLVEQKRLDPKRAKRILTEILEAVGAAHELAIIHKDLTPSNVQVSDSRGKTHVKVTNFGIARVAATSQPITGAIPPMALASKVFAAPELIDGEPGGRHSDLYSIGVIAYLMLTGELPDTDTRTALPEAISGTALATVVERLLALDIDARYRTATDALDALRPGRPDKSAPTGPAPAAALSSERGGSEFFEEAEQMTSASPAAPTSHRSVPRGTLLVVAGVTVLLLGACALVLSLLPGKGEGEKQETDAGFSDDAGRTAKLAEVTPAPVRPSSVIVTIETRPSGALVVVDGRAIGRTPFELETAPSDTPIAVTLTRDGYRELPTPISIKDDATVVFGLESVGRR